uniref:Non-haem dioxygenase N-terminal domain-containing protein n=1 Tax=Salix viminalis TaxID=40686 RepID=A0A6N2M725_SALVM
MDNTTAAPPPTPSAQPNSQLASSAAAADALSRLLHRLPPTLSLPTRRSNPAATSFPLISLSDPNLQDLLFSASSQLGYFQLTNHNIPCHLATSAELESVSLFELPKDKKESHFPKNWPLGFEGDEYGNGESFLLDAECSTVSTELVLASLPQLTRALEKVGLEVIELLSKGAGFENPLAEDPTRNCSLLWLHGAVDGNDGLSGGSYPYIVGLQYQIRCQKYSLLSDSGWVTVLPQVDSIMVTVGDIAQVWSNGRLKKVRGRPVASLGDCEKSSCISMSLFVTLPSESTVSPLLPKVIADGVNAKEDEIGEDEEQDDIHSICKTGRRLFSSFSFEDYAWRVYHEPLLFKDPLDKYRI